MSHTSKYNFFDRHQRVLFAVLLIGALALAVSKRFVMDDAFISFHYARNLVEGKGLTWFGARVEGYTNFLWVIWIALGLQLGMDPAPWSWIGSIAAFAAVLFGIHRLARQMLPDASFGFLCLLIFVGNHSFVAFATGGLETMLQAALLLWCALMMFKGDAKSLWMAGTLAALGLLTRLDSAVLLAIPLGWLVFRSENRTPLPKKILPLALPVLTLVLPWMIWKYVYYGQLLPNPFFIKTSLGDAFNPNGFIYLGRFLNWYLLWPFLAVGLAVMAVRRIKPSAVFTICLLIVAAWMTYIAAIGGDFMEFRLMTPAAPFLTVALAWLVREPIGRTLLQKPGLAAIVSLAVLTAASQIHAARFKTITPDQTLDSVSILADCYRLYPDRDWSAIGKPLNSLFDGKNVMIALHATGAIPYYSRIKTIDMWGINDAYVASNGLTDDDYRRPGHRKMAPLNYMKSSGVNFVIGHPVFVPSDFARRPDLGKFLANWIVNVFPFEYRAIRQAEFVFIPIGPGKSLVAVYLQPTPEMDRLIAERGWTRVMYRQSSMRP